MPVPMDEYPIHQLPLSLEYVGTGDRNFYDRCYFAGHDRTGDILLITGLGVYPNLGVTDAYATVRRGDRQWAVRFSDAKGGASSSTPPSAATSRAASPTLCPSRLIRARAGKAEYAGH